jgi:hypothetical protein
VDGDEGQIRTTWSVDYALLDGGPVAGRIVEITPDLPLRLIINWGGGEARRRSTAVYKKVLNGKYASRNDQGQVVYFFCEEQ